MSRASIRDAIEANYGGDDPDLPGKSFTSAYMLVYIKKSCISEFHVYFTFSITYIEKHSPRGTSAGVFKSYCRRFDRYKILSDITTAYKTVINR